jgi:DNA repair protein RadC
MSDVLKIKDIPDAERPRERLIKSGAEFLSMQELLSVIIEKGSRDVSVLEMSQTLLKIISQKNNYGDITYEELKSIKGFGISNACKILASLELAKRVIHNEVKRTQFVSGSEKAFLLLKPYFFNETRELFIILSLDSRNKFIAIDKVSIGTINQSLVHPREVFSTIIKRRATYFIVSHNHPSGDPAPSNEDISVTKKLYDISKTVGIPLIDHIIISQNQYFSFKDHKYIAGFI